METLMGRAWEATPKKECRYWPGRRISKTSSRIKINYIKACQLHRRKDAGRCDESVKKKEERRRNQRTRPTTDEGPEEERAGEDRYRRTHSRRRRLMERLLSDRRVELAEASGRLHPSGRH